MLQATKDSSPTQDTYKRRQRLITHTTLRISQGHKTKTLWVSTILHKSHKWAGRVTHTDHSINELEKRVFKKFLQLLASDLQCSCQYFILIIKIFLANWKTKGNTKENIHKMRRQGRTEDNLQAAPYRAWPFSITCIKPTLLCKCPTFNPRFPSASPLKAGWEMAITVSSTESKTHRLWGSAYVENITTQSCTYSKKTKKSAFNHSILLLYWHEITHNPRCYQGLVHCITLYNHTLQCIW